MDGQILDFGTTGLLRFSDLVMYDRQTQSWWQEFSGEAIVGDMTGKALEVLPMSMVPWKEFKSAFPDGKVLSRNTGFTRDYGTTPYIGYDSFYSSIFLPADAHDDRLPAMERVMAVNIGGESLAVPYSVLEREPVVHYTLAGQDLVVFYKEGTASVLDTALIILGRDVGSAVVFDSHLEGQKLTFRADGDNIVDEQTGSAWDLLGSATSGPLEGKRLTPIPHMGSQLWFSWAVFKPDTIVYRGQ